MYKGIYIAASGAELKQKHMDVIANNLANVNTAGFKKDGITFKDFLVSNMSERSQLNDRRDMAATSSRYTNYEPGGVKETGNPLSLAIDGKGFFAVDGNMYTRRGDFTLDSEGFLTLPGGKRVIGEGGFIQIPPGAANIDINSEGDVSANGSVVGRITVNDFANPGTLVKNEAGFFTTDETPLPGQSRIRQGFVETSNVNVVDEMVTMIQTQREFETYQKIIQAFDEATGRVTNDMARV